MPHTGMMMTMIMGISDDLKYLDSIGLEKELEKECLSGE